ncbi:MAG TPA: cytochrome c [Sphingobacteriaceae bacterium]
MKDIAMRGNLKRLLKNRIVWKMGILLLAVSLSAFGEATISRKLSTNPENAISDIASKDTLCDKKLLKGDPAELKKPLSVNESATAQVAYMVNCHACHGVDRMGASGPSLYNLSKRVSFNEFKAITSAGRAQMPGFRLLDEKTIITLYKFLSDFPIKKGDHIDKEVEYTQ